MEVASELAPSAKQTIEAPSDPFELSVENLRKWLLEPFEHSRRPLIEAKKQMQDDGVSDQLISQSLAWDKGVMERHYAETIKLTTNPKTGKLWDLDTLEAAGMVSDAERENIIRAHDGREPHYWYVSQVHRVFDDRVNKSYLTASCMFEGLCVGKREYVINPEPNRKINTSWTMGVEHSVPLEWNLVKDSFDRTANADEEKRVATFNSRNFGEGGNSPKIYTIPFSRETAEKLISLSKDGVPGLSIKKTGGSITHGVKSVEEFLTEDKDLAGLIKRYEEPQTTYKFDIDPKALAEFMKFQQTRAEHGDHQFQ